MAAAEGVVKFAAAHRQAPLPPRLYADAARTLAAWRELLVRLGMLGQDPMRYGGAGFGNVSARVGPFGGDGRGRRRFLITGTQTGGRRQVSLADFCLVERYDVGDNRVESIGPAPPSSEAMTHGAIYDAAPAARAVLHGHAPELWRRARPLGLAATRAEVEYGTPAMAREVGRLLRETAAAERGVLVMGGHQDGVIALGRSVEEAGAALARELGRALEAA